MKDYLALIDRRTLGLKGMRCRDITPIFADPEAFATMLDDLQRGLPEFDLVVGVEALGFVLASAIAVRTGKGLIPIRKAGKLPVRADAITLPEVRGQARTLELRAGAIPPGSRLLLVDDWIKTGTQVAGAIELLERQLGTVAAVVSLNIDENELTRPLLARYRFQTILRDGNLLEVAR
ncbi:MAG: phosphoribosyltransferase family protein [Meiothermus sp.]|nr:phosphoribosyltransferase family protein [Meiothermus sp.]